MTSTPTRPVDNVVITTKGLQDRNINILDGTTVENKGKLILSAFIIYFICRLGLTFSLNRIAIVVIITAIVLIEDYTINTVSLLFLISVILLPNSLIFMCVNIFCEEQIF